MNKKKPFLIAELSANHFGNFQHAKKLIKCAKKNGADAVKLQTYTADTMTINSNKKYFKIKDGLWKGRRLWDLFNEAHTPLKWHPKLFSYAKSLGIKIFSTPFDESAVDFLEKLNCPMYKVSSFEITDLLLIKKIAKTKKPIIISTGTASLKEIELAFKTAKKYGAKKITLLYCVSNYPSKVEDFNFKNIKILKEKFKCKVGLSDHSTDNRVAITAAAMGATVFEKHIATEKQTKGLDIKFSIRGKEIQKYKDDINLAFNLAGGSKRKIDNSDKKSKIFRRSIFACRNIKKGEKFTRENIKKVRPNYGLNPKYFEEIINRKCLKNIGIGDPITKNCVKIHEV
jgi:pseudaminic acid synthase